MFLNSENNTHGLIIAQAKFDPKYDPEAVQTNLAESAFTRRREVLVGRLAVSHHYYKINGFDLFGTVLSTLDPNNYNNCLLDVSYIPQYLISPLKICDCQ